MAKRALCLLLALAAVFSLAAPALAEGEPVAEPEEVEAELKTAAGPQVIESGTCGAQGDNLTWKLTGTMGENGVVDTNVADWVMTISGQGDMADYTGNYYDQPWSMYLLSILQFQKIVIEEGVTGIGSFAFIDSSAASISLPSTLKAIASGAFYRMRGLVSVSIPSGVTEIGINAFCDCSALTSVTIKNAVCKIDDGDYTLGVPGTTVISGYDGSTAQAYAEKNGYTFQSLGPASTAEPTSEPAPEPGPQVIESGTCGENVRWSISSDGVLTISGTGPMTDYASYNDVPWYPYGTSIKNVVIENGVTSIGGYAFWGFHYPPSVTIPDSVTRIGKYAFSGCEALTSVTIPDGVTSIEDGTFSSCVSLTSMTIPNGVTSIGERAFNQCVSLASLTIPNSVTSIGDSAFWGCIPLTSVTIPGSVTSIGDSAFGTCTSLTDVTIENGVKSIGDGAFDNCTSLKNLTIGNGVTSIGDDAFYWCQSLTSVTIPDSVTSIGQAAFASCEHLTSVTIPADVTSIEDGAFNGCAALADVTIQNGVTSIGQYAFANCTSLPSVSIPASVTEIGPCAFDGCAGLTKITILNPKCGIPWLVNDSDTNFETIPAKTTIYGYDGSTAEAYAKKSGNKFVSLGKAPVTPTSKPTATPKPTAVPTLSVPTVTIAQTADGIKVSWNKIAGSPRYMVYYKENNGGWKQIGTTTATSYTRKTANLKTGVTYAFTVRCCANDKKTMLSGYKASNSLTYSAAELAAPTVTISKAADGIKVSWNKIDGAPRYMVYYKENGGSWTKIGTTTSTTYTRAAKYLKSGAKYQFTVRCCANDKKTMLGPYKASNSLTYTATAQLAAPTVKIEKVATGIKVSWNKVTGSPRYMVYYKEGNGGWKKIGTTTATSYTRAAKYLKSGTTYQFTVRCCQNDKKTLLGPYKASNSLKYTK